MTRNLNAWFVLIMIAANVNAVLAVEPACETPYLSFQLMTGLQGYAGPPPPPGRSSLGKSQLEPFVREVANEIGTTGDARQKLCFAVGPLCFDMTYDETRLFIRELFEVARENNMAIAFHIDDSMLWSKRKDLLANPANIETAGWDEKPNAGRRADWGPEPTKFPPQMCFNSPEIVAAVKARALLIGREIDKELTNLKSHGQQQVVLPLTQKLEKAIKDKQWLEADKVADQLLAMINDNLQEQVQANSSPIQERLPAKLQKIQKELPVWVFGSRSREKQATELMKSLDSNLQSQNLEQAEKAADDLLALIEKPDPDGNAENSAPDDEARRHILHELGSAFIISRKNVREELKLSDEQKKQIDSELMTHVRNSIKLFVSLNDRLTAEREKLLQAHRETCRDKFLPRLKTLLHPDQFSRYQQLMLQHESPGSFGRPDVQHELEFTDEQRQQFVNSVQEMQKKIEPLIKEAQATGKHQEIRSKVIQLRRECEEQIEGFMTETQKKKWLSLRGDPVNVLED